MSNHLIPAAWRLIWRQNFTHWEKLADFLELSPEQRDEILKNPRFPLNLPLRLATKIRKNMLDDPILRQFLPMNAESESNADYTCDPVADASFRKAPKLLHKYEGRALLVCTSACVMNCRFCFRQNFDYAEQKDLFVNELDIIGSDPSIHEVILSGGDPLSLSDPVLEQLMQAITAIPHVNRLRIHTRFPLGIPERIDESFLSMLSHLDKQVWFVIHTNHPSELDNDVFQRLKQLQKLGIVVLNQSVLLKDVNDNIETLKQLCETLVDNGIIPYYLHQLDRVQGAAHFAVSEEKGRQLIQELAKQLSGYAVPKYVSEIPGKPGKTLL